MLVKITVCFHSASCSHSKREPLSTMHGMLVKGLSKWDCIYSLFWILLFSKMALRTELRNSIEKAPLHSSGFFNVPGYAIACLLCAGSAYLCLCQVSESCHGQLSSFRFCPPCFGSVHIYSFVMSLLKSGLPWGTRPLSNLAPFHRQGN